MPSGTCTVRKADCGRRKRLGRAISSGVSEWGRTVVLLAAMMVALAGIVLFAQGSAGAHDHRVPRTTLMKGKEELQTGRKVEEFTWAYPSRSGSACIVDEGTFPLIFPGEAPTVAAGSKLKVRIYKSQQPDTFSITAYSRLKGTGEPVGATGRLLETSLERVVRDGRTVAWDAIFNVDRADTDYYLVSEGHWQDRDCTNIDQFAHWAFHARTGSAP
jgi:hypothetical protein